MTSLSLHSNEDLLRQPCGDVEVVDGGVTIVACARTLQAFASHNDLNPLPQLSASAFSSVLRRSSVNTVNSPSSARCKVVGRRLIQGWATAVLSVASRWRNGRRLDLQHNFRPATQRSAARPSTRDIAMQDPSSMQSQRLPPVLAVYVDVGMARCARSGSRLGTRRKIAAKRVVTQ